jgi:hypothetical protein
MREKDRPAVFSMEIARTHDSAFVVVTGALTAGTGDRLTRAVDRLTSAGIRRIVVDLSCVLDADDGGRLTVDRLAARRCDGIVVTAAGLVWLLGAVAHVRSPRRDRCRAPRATYA